MKIALMGSAPSSIHLLPFANPEWTVWGCSPGALVYGNRAHVWFELHRYEPGQPWFSEGYCKFLENFPGPVYMSHHVPSIKNCVVLPVDDLVAKYGPYFFNSSLSWMMAMAMEAGATTIGLWGVDMAANEEYFSQKMGLIVMTQIARAKGIEVGVPPESDVFTPPPLYGVCEVSHAHIKNTIRFRELTQRKNDAELKRAQAEQEIHFLSGALDDMNYQIQTWHSNEAQRKSAYLEPAPMPALDEINLARQIDTVTIRGEQRDLSEFDKSLVVTPEAEKIMRDTLAKKEIKPGGDFAVKGVEIKGNKASAKNAINAG